MDVDGRSGLTEEAADDQRPCSRLAGSTPSAHAGALEVRDLWVAYGSRTVVRGVSFAVRPGEILALFGPNGSGKSSLLRAVAGLQPVRSGVISFDGVDVTRRPAHVRSRLGIRTLLQDRGVFPSLPIRENVLLGYGRRPGPEATFPPAHDGALLQLPPSRMADLAGTLSGGERRLLAMDMVLSSDRRCLLLDEPTAGLSPTLVRLVLTRVATISRENAVPILLVEQNVSAAMAVADRILLLRQGVGADVDRSDLARDPRLLFETPRNAPAVPE
jgi:branched-chain amino acid transport system ATP-binding protein